MNPNDKYMLQYTGKFPFEYTEHISIRIFDVEIDVDVFEYDSEYVYREKAHAVFKKDSLTYECELCDKHCYQNAFFPLIINGRRFICFRKTIYGFTLIAADTLSEEYEYFPEYVLDGEESFIIADVKQMDSLLIFDGCYWAFPYECFAFDCNSKLFLNVSEICDIASVDKTEVKSETLTIYGNDKSGRAKEAYISKKDILFHVKNKGTPDF